VHGNGQATRVDRARDDRCAALRNWGEPTRVDEFDGAALGEEWGVYDGPGHARNGRRTSGRSQRVGRRDDDHRRPRDNTAGMEWGGGQRYGRWEGRMKAPASDETYNALLLWPDAKGFPVGGEIDFMEMMDHTRQKAHVFDAGRRERASPALVHASFALLTASWRPSASGGRASA
jgi:hypothetical protein